MGSWRTEFPNGFPLVEEEWRQDVSSGGSGNCFVSSLSLPNLEAAMHFHWLREVLYFRAHRDQWSSPPQLFFTYFNLMIISNSPSDSRLKGPPWDLQGYLQHLFYQIRQPPQVLRLGLDVHWNCHSQVCSSQWFKSILHRKCLQGLCPSQHLWKCLSFWLCVGESLCTG